MEFPHGVHAFKTYSSGNSFHRWQSYRDGLLQCESSIGWQVLPEKLSLCLLFFTGPSSCHAISLLLSGVSTGAIFLQETFSCSGVGSFMSCRWISAPQQISTGGRGAAWLTMVCTSACRGIFALAPGAPSSMSVELLHSHFLIPLSQLLCCNFCPFWNMLWQRCYQWAQSWPACGQWQVHPGAGWNWLCWPWRQLLMPPHWSYPWSSHISFQNLAM